jgi:hypothetical protein
MKPAPSRAFAAAALLATLASARPVSGDHGPSTSGGGTVVRSAELAPAGTVGASLRTDTTFYEPLSDAEMGRMAARVQGHHAHVDALDWSLLTTVELSMVVLPRLQLAVSTGWYRGQNLRQGHTHFDAPPELHQLGHVMGATDLWIGGTGVLLTHETSSLAVSAGVKLPTGRDDVRAEGTTERLEPALQPGSGAFDFAVGAAYTHHLGGALTLDASAQLVLRTEANDAQIGHRIEGGLAATWQVTRDHHAAVRLAVGLELLARHILRNEEEGITVSNTGGTVLMASPILRLQIGRHLTLTAAPQLPLVQALHGEQQETVVRVVVTAAVTL